MALLPEQIELYEDRIWFFRRVPGAKDALGNPTSDAQPIEGLQNLPCKIFMTDNYDDVSGPHGRTKADNLMTSDYVHLEHVHDIRADDLAIGYQAGLAVPEVFSVSGAPKKRAYGNYQRLYIITRPDDSLSIPQPESPSQSPQAFWLDADAAMTGQRVTLVGRYLTLENLTVGGVQATILERHETDLVFQMPAGLSGVQNVRFGTIAEPGALIGTLQCVGAVNDPLGIGKAWAADVLPLLSNVVDPATFGAVGNGTADDTAAIQAALDLVRTQGGGTVDLQGKTYAIDFGFYLSVYPKTVVRNGKLTYGHRYAPDGVSNTSDYAIALRGSNIVLADLEFENVAPVQGGGLIRGAFPSDPGETTNLQNALLRLKVDQGKGRPITLVRPTDLVMRECELSATAAGSSVLGINDGTRVTVEGCTMDYRANRLGFTFLTRSVFRNNECWLDGEYFTAATVGGGGTGGLETSFSQRILIADNTIGIRFEDGVFSDRPGVDGELINPQRSIVGDFAGVFMVASAVGTTLTVDGTWGGDTWLDPVKPQLLRHTAKILEGTGVRQWRWIASHDAVNGLTVDRAWDVLPDSTSRVQISVETCFQQTIARNRLVRGYSSVSLYSGALQSDVVDNVLEDSGQFVVRAPVRTRNATPHSGTEIMGAWDVRVLGNRVVNSLGISTASFTLYGHRVEPSVDYPNLIRDVLIGGNRFEGLGMVDLGGEVAFSDGIILKAIRYSGGPMPADRCQNVVVRADNELLNAGLYAIGMEYATA